MSFTTRYNQVMADPRSSSETKITWFLLSCQNEILSAHRYCDQCHQETGEPEYSTDKEGICRISKMTCGNCGNLIWSEVVN